MKKAKERIKTKKFKGESGITLIALVVFISTLFVPFCRY